MILEAALVCLATNVFFEARSEPIPGQYAVAQVTMRRARGQQGRVCRVVYAKHQFSWTSQRRRSPAKIDPDAFDKAKKIAWVVLNNGMPLDFSQGASHFHAEYVYPEWARSFPRTTQVGQHIFYRQG